MLGVIIIFLKKILKKAIGDKYSSNLKGVVLHYVISVKLFIKKTKKIYINDSFFYKKMEIYNKNYHYFRGYYDIQYMNEDKNMFLLHRLSTSSKKNEPLKCDIGFYDIKRNQYQKVAESYAWCWQQGSRLRWNPVNKNQLIYNDVEDRNSNKNYCTKVFDIKQNKIVKIIEQPLYDITPDFSYGLSLNFSKLQHFRPGYGYSFLNDKSSNDYIQDHDGIFLVNIRENESSLIISLKELAEKISNYEKYDHYINHISIAPDGKNFIFFHVYKEKKSKEWQTILYVSEIKGEKIHPLEYKDRASHYSWINNYEVIVTLKSKQGREYYCIYNIKSDEKTIFNKEELFVDGHPDIIGNLMVTDTYPLKNSFQKLLIGDLNNKKFKEIAAFYHDYRSRGEKRCDLHPSLSKLSEKNYIVSVDTTYKKNRCVNILWFNM